MESGDGIHDFKVLGQLACSLWFSFNMGHTCKPDNLHFLRREESVSCQACTYVSLSHVTTFMTFMAVSIQGEILICNNRNCNKSIKSDVHRRDFCNNVEMNRIRII